MARPVTAAARVMGAAMEQGSQTPTSLALVLESAQLLMSPETAAELEELRARVAELETQLRTLNTQRGDAALLIERERQNGEECVDIDDIVSALVLGADEMGGASC